MYNEQTVVNTSEPRINDNDQVIENSCAEEKKGQKNQFDQKHIILMNSFH